MVLHWGHFSYSFGKTTLQFEQSMVFWASINPSSFTSWRRLLDLSCSMLSMNCTYFTNRCNFDLFFIKPRFFIVWIICRYFKDLLNSIAPYSNSYSIMILVHKASGLYYQFFTPKFTCRLGNITCNLESWQFRIIYYLLSAIQYIGKAWTTSQHVNGFQ